MPKFHLSNKAVEDLAEIWEYTYNEWSEKQADLYYKFLINTFQDLAENPKEGKNTTKQEQLFQVTYQTSTLYFIRQFQRMKQKLLEFYMEAWI